MDSININRKMHLKREMMHVQMLLDTDTNGRLIERYMHVLSYLETQIKDLDNA